MYANIHFQVHGKWEVNFFQNPEKDIKSCRKTFFSAAFCDHYLRKMVESFFSPVRKQERFFRSVWLVYISVINLEFFWAETPQEIPSPWIWVANELGHFCH